MAGKRRKDDELPGKDRAAKKAHVKTRAPPAVAAKADANDNSRKKGSSTRAAEEGDEPDFPRGESPLFIVVAWMSVEGLSLKLFVPWLLWKPIVAVGLRSTEPSAGSLAVSELN